MKSSVGRQKAHLPAALASLNNGHSSNLRACNMGVKSSSRPNFVPTRPLHLRSVAWRSSLVANLSNTVSRHTPIVEVEARIVTSRYHVVAMTLVCSLFWPCNNYMLNRCTNFFSVSPSLRHRLSLCSSCLGASVKVSTA
jgi:hypothetical protein